MRKNKYYIQYPYEYFLAQFMLVFKVLEIKSNEATSETSPTSKIGIVHRYTWLYAVMTDHTMADDNKNKWVWDLLKKFEDIVNSSETAEEAATKTYELYLEQPYAKKKLEQIVQKKATHLKDLIGCFAVSYKEYYQKINTVRLHFIPTRDGLQHPPDSEFYASDLSKIYMPERIKEFTQVMKHIRDNTEKFGDAKYFMSSTWLQNVPAYRNLFPESDNAVREVDPNATKWLWPQFMRWNFEGNTRRLQQFEDALSKATTVEEALNAIPLQAEKVVVPLEDMYKKYLS